MAEGINIKVQTNVLTRKAGEITDAVSKVEREFAQLESAVSRSAGYWTGDASDVHRKYLREIKLDMQDVIKRLKEHPKDLLAMAGVYEEAETEAAGAAGALPADVIV